jgi:endonuclease IV
MTELQQLATYLGNVFNGYTKKTDSDDNIDNMKKVLEDVFPEKATEIQSAFEANFPTQYPTT